MKIKVTDRQAFESSVFGGDCILRNCPGLLTPGGARVEFIEEMYYFVTEDGKVIHDTCFLTSGDFRQKSVEVVKDAPKLTWNPVETAPKDGTHFIGMDGVGGIHRAKWDANGGQRINWFRVTDQGWLPSLSHWIDIPDTL